MHMMELCRSLFLFLALGSIIPANALYFYMDSTNPKCFYEELPKDTLVVGMTYPLQTPHFNSH